MFNIDQNCHQEEQYEEDKNFDKKISKSGKLGKYKKDDNGMTICTLEL